MTLEMIPLNKLRPSAGNPRKRFDEEAIAGLAQSIRCDGLLQNLVAAKPEGRKRYYPIISGERRYRALCLLVEQGDLPADMAVPVEVREALSEEDTLRIAAIENIQREDLSPLEETAAIAALVESGDGLAEIAAQTGLSENTIKRRLALLELSENVKAALAEHRINLVQAEALSLGNHDEQDELLERVIDGWYSAPADIKGYLIGESPTVAMAIFAKEAYQGTFTADLFAEDETTYFDDAEQFYELQKAAAEHLASQYEQTRDWAEFVEGRYPSLAYREAEDGESGGVIVQLCANGKVQIHEGLVRKAINASVSRAINPKPKAAYARPLREYIAMHKSAAVQMELLSKPRKLKEIAAANMLYEACVHPCYSYLLKSEEGEAYLGKLECEAEILLTALDETAYGDATQTLLSLAHSTGRAYALVQRLDDEMLERLSAFLIVLRFGQSRCDELDTNERSLFNRVAIDIGADMRKHWTPGIWFLMRCSASQLQSILTDSGLSRLYGNGKGYKKAELVQSMARYFGKVRDMEQAQPDQQKARDWLPEAMQFPAVNPDTLKAKTEEESAGIEAEAGTALAEAA